MKGIIAIDGGGSKTELVLVSAGGGVCYRDISSCSNPNDIGIGKSVAVLTNIIKKAIDKSYELKINIECIMLAIAGVEFGNIADCLKNQIQANLGVDNLVIKGDLASVIELHLADKDNGVVIISGTGFNMAFKEDNKIFTVGGWGHIPDNYLSGFDLGKDALIAAARAIDGVGENTVLVERLKEYYNHNLWYSMDEIYKSGIKGVASLSKVVINGYKDNDLVCKRIVNERVMNLAQVIKVKTNSQSRDIFLCGGIFENNAIVVNKLSEYLGDDYRLYITTDKTICGATRLAIKHVNITINEEFLRTFDASYKEVCK